MARGLCTSTRRRPKTLRAANLLADGDLRIEACKRVKTSKKAMDESHPPQQRNIELTKEANKLVAVEYMNPNNAMYTAPELELEELTARMNIHPAHFRKPAEW